MGKFWSQAPLREGDPTWPGPIQVADRPTMLILPGIAGPDGRTWHLLSLLQQRGFASQIWDWTRIVEPPTDVQNICRDLNRERAGVLNHHLAAWLESTGGKRMTVVASSGGSELLALATQRPDFPQDFLFERIVLLSASAPPEWAMGLASSSRDDAVFSYASDADGVLGSIFGRIIVPKAVGLHGCEMPTPKVRELHWSARRDKPLNNPGGHLDCLKEPFVSKCLLPVITLETDDWPIECQAPPL